MHRRKTMETTKTCSWIFLVIYKNRANIFQISFRPAVGESLNTCCSDVGMTGLTFLVEVSGQTNRVKGNLVQKCANDKNLEDDGFLKYFLL